MLFRAPAVLAVALFAGYALATPPGGSTGCQPGEQPTADGCEKCPDGYVSSDGTQCVACPPGQSSNGGQNTEGPQGQNPNGGNTQCAKCKPGTFNDHYGGTCVDCPTGYFNNVSGAKSCCQCCAGFYSNNPRTHCNKCNQSEKYSFPGSNSNDDCKATNALGQPEPVTECKMVADNVCPNTTDGGPTGTAISRKKRALHCTKGFKACPLMSGVGGVECVDTQNDPESCGGCVSLDGKGSGIDCTAIDGVSVTRCVKGSCVIDSCGKGYAKSLDGSSCTLSSADGSNPEAFSSQSLGATSKRGVRGRFF